MVQIKKKNSESTLRVLTSNVVSNKFKDGDIVEFVDNSPSPRGRRPTTLTLGKQYKVRGVGKCIICIQNDRGDFISFYSNRFKKSKRR